MLEEYQSIPDGLCPTCFSDISDTNYDFFDDPLLTPKGLSGDNFKGVKSLSYIHLSQLRIYYNILQRIAGFGHDNGKVSYSAATIDVDEYSKSVILELRQVVENILMGMGWSLNQYFNWTKSGYLVRNTRLAWEDSLDIEKLTKIRAIHIEQLRHGLCPVWIEWWKDSIDDPIIHNFYGLEGMVSNTRDWEITRGTSIDSLNNKIWTFSNESESSWDYSNIYPYPNTSEKLLKLTPEWLSYQAGGTWFLGDNYFPLKLGNRPLLYKVDFQSLNMEAETTWEFYKTDYSKVKQYTGNEDSYPHTPPEDIIVARCYNEIRIRIVSISSWEAKQWVTEELTYILTYPLIGEEEQEYPVRDIIKVESFDESLEIAADFARVFGINPEEWLILDWDILTKNQATTDIVYVWGDYHPTYPELRYLDIYHYKGKVNSLATIGKNTIYYDPKGNYVLEDLSSQIDGEQGVFELENTPIKSSIILKLNGIELIQGSVEEPKDYFIAGNEVILTTPPTEGSSLEIEYLSEY